MTSAKTGWRYELLVSLPEGYAKSAQSYPVLYVLNGWHFLLVAFLQGDDICSKRMPPVIIVNVSHGGVDDNTLRARAFTPAKTPGYANSGGAPACLEFLEQDLIPFVDRTSSPSPPIAAFSGIPSVTCLRSMRWSSGLPSSTPSSR